MAPVFWPNFKRLVTTGSPDSKWIIVQTRIRIQLRDGYGAINCPVSD